jgi:hypothetical protein
MPHHDEWYDAAFVKSEVEVAGGKIFVWVEARGASLRVGWVKVRNSKLDFTNTVKSGQYFLPPTFFL